MVNTIERPMTETELKALETDGRPGVNLGKGKKRLTSTERFELELKKHEKEATKKGLPFARHAARDDFNNSIKEQKDKQLRMYGRIEYPEELKLPSMKWDDYSDTKNFDLVEEKTRTDDYLTKINPGLHVEIKTKVYKYKGYGNKYTVMEDGPSAIARAQKKLADTRK